MVPEKQIITKALVVLKPGFSCVLRDVVLDGLRTIEVSVELKFTGCATLYASLTHGLESSASRR